MDGFHDVTFFDLMATVSGSSGPEPGHRHTQYAIDVLVPGSNRAWTIHRRYHEFKRLNGALYAVAFPGPRLPPRQVWGPRTKTMLERRAESLDMWLQGTLAVWKSFYAPGDDDASLTVTSLLTVFLCRDQEFIVSQALAQQHSAASSQLMYDESSRHSRHGGGHSLTPHHSAESNSMTGVGGGMRRVSSHATALDQQSSSSSQDGKFQRIVRRMARNIKSIFHVSMDPPSSSNSLSVARGEGEENSDSGTTNPMTRKSNTSTSGGEQHTLPPTPTGGTRDEGDDSGDDEKADASYQQPEQQAPSNWLVRGRMMFKRKSGSSRSNNQLLASPTSAKTTGGDKRGFLGGGLVERKGKRKQNGFSADVERMMSDTRPIISPTEEGSVHRVYAAAPASSSLAPSGTATAAPQHVANGAALTSTTMIMTGGLTSALVTSGTTKKTSPQKITFSETTTTIPILWNHNISANNLAMMAGSEESTMRRVISMMDDDGSELEWVFDSEEDEDNNNDNGDEKQSSRRHRHHRSHSQYHQEEHPTDSLFLGEVIAYRPQPGEEKKKPLEQLFDISLQVPLIGGVDVLRNGFGMVSVPPSPRAREVFKRPWKAYTDKLLFHVQRRLETTTRSRASSGDNNHAEQWMDSGSEEGGSEAGGDDRDPSDPESVFVQRARWLQDTFREPRGSDGHADDEAGLEVENDGYDSEGWASEAANESYDGGHDQEVFGSWEEGTIWIGPKRAPEMSPPSELRIADTFLSPPVSPSVAALKTSSPFTTTTEFNVEDDDEGEDEEAESSFYSEDEDEDEEDDSDLDSSEEDDGQDDMPSSAEDEDDAEQEELYSDEDEAALAPDQSVSRLATLVHDHVRVGDTNVDEMDREEDGDGATEEDDGGAFRALSQNSNTEFSGSGQMKLELGLVPHASSPSTSDSSPTASYGSNGSDEMAKMHFITSSVGNGENEMHVN